MGLSEKAFNTQNEDSNKGDECVDGEWCKIVTDEKRTEIKNICRSSE